VKKKDNLVENKNKSFMPKTDTNVLSAGMMFIACIIICWVGGYYLDKILHSGHKYTHIGIFFGIFCGLYNFVKIIIEAISDSAKK